VAATPWTPTPRCSSTDSSEPAAHNRPHRRTLAADLARVGPVLILVGGGGLVDLDIDEINEMFEKQIDRYVAAATR
jgi:hypothetical protein